MLDPNQEQVLGEIFSNISSQLRSALGNLHLAAAALAPASRREEDPALDAKAALLDQSYYQLLRLMGNLTAAATLENTNPLPLRDQDIVQLVRTQCETVSSLVEMKGLELRFRCEMESHVCALHVRSLEQLLYQLLSNAMKFTKEGSVTVELRKVNRRLLLSVSDTGCGISEQQLPTLFDRYLHPELMDPAPHGLGLGLPLCRSIMERHGGTIMAESQLGKGTSVICSFPDQTCGNLMLADTLVDYSGGFNVSLLGLADALPARAFALKNQD